MLHFQKCLIFKNWGVSTRKVDLYSFLMQSTEIRSWWIQRIGLAKKKYNSYYDYNQTIKENFIFKRKVLWFHKTKCKSLHDLIQYHQFNPILHSRPMETIHYSEITTSHSSRMHYRIPHSKPLITLTITGMSGCTSIITYMLSFL